jgi:hypothetical protein
LNPKEELLAEAEELVNGARASDYGDSLMNHGRISDLWNIWLRNRSWGKDGIITPYDAAMMMILVKIARCQYKPGHQHHVDMAGYAAICEDVWEKLMMGVSDGGETEPTTSDE